MKRILTSVSAYFVFMTMNGQEIKCPSIPENYAWNTPEEYASDSVLVRTCLEWLCQANISTEFEKRTEVNAFVMTWLTNSPWVRLSIDSKTLPFMKHNPDLFFVFAHGMALYAMKHKGASDKLLLHAEGLKAVARLAWENEVLSKSDYLRPLLKAARSDKRLRKYVTKQLA